ncbi:MAG: UDP-GlcNAc diphosphorylase/GlcNAc-P N-acetyltransferase, GlmU, bacterial-type [Gemmatimonadetes bacterium]|nr:UDP-GlcNAc diphosphorylase/GlcNAc-P N-acetyltransferase, GlmU, bacterial-type [Gemmatimonadota bacterium]
MTVTAPLVLLEPEDAIAWAPFHGARPICELRAGLWRIRDRWEATLGVATSAILGDNNIGFHEIDAPESRLVEAVHGPLIVARSDFAPAGTRMSLGPEVRRLTAGGITVAWIIPEGETWHADLLGASQEVDGILLRGSFDLITALEQLLEHDCADFLTGPTDPLPTQTIVLGDASRVRSSGAEVEPGVVFDVRHGVVVIDHGAEVGSGTRLEGPCYVGPGARVLGGFIRGSILGPRSVVRGEVSATIFNGYANKGHDGFVGHSVIGHWVNLGAGTTTSNLKNTYGTVRLVVAGRTVDTGRQFLGSLIGDHAKTAIGTMLPTGTVVGAGANVFGEGLGKYVPPFSWGASGDVQLTEEGFLRIAERVMPRRDVAVTAERRASLISIFRRLSAR